MLREDVVYGADQEHRRHCGERRQQRLAVEERRDDEEARQADEQRAIARVARLEELDGDEHVQERDAGLAAEEVSVGRP